MIDKYCYPLIVKTIAYVEELSFSDRIVPQEADLLMKVVNDFDSEIPYSIGSYL